MLQCTVSPLHLMHLSDALFLQRDAVVFRDNQSSHTEDSQTYERSSSQLTPHTHQRARLLMTLNDRFVPQDTPAADEVLATQRYATATGELEAGIRRPLRPT